MSGASFFFLWLNDATPDRHYWDRKARDFTTDFAHATRFPNFEAAEREARRAVEKTNAEVVIQEKLVG